MQRCGLQFFQQIHQCFSFKKLYGTSFLTYQIRSWNSPHEVRRPRRSPRPPETRYRKLILRSTHDLGVFNVLSLIFHLLRFQLLISFYRIHAPADRDSLLKEKLALSIGVASASSKRHPNSGRGISSTNTFWLVQAPLVPRG
jgi:hypothetical protein